MVLLKIKTSYPFPPILPPSSESPCLFSLKLYLSFKIMLSQAIPLLRINPREIKTCPHKNCTQLFIPILIIVVKKNGRSPFVLQLINKMWCAHTMEYYWVLKRYEALIHATTCINLENTMLSKGIHSIRSHLH